jgi:predicted HicB family RNase H-like nuclease
MNQTMTRQALEYKGFTASVEWSGDEGCFSGQVADTWGTIGFAGKTLEEANQEFMEMLDWYLEDCERDGEEPRMSKRGALAHSV